MIYFLYMQLINLLSGGNYVFDVSFLQTLKRVNYGIQISHVIVSKT